MGSSATMPPPMRSTMRPVSVVFPMTAQLSSHLAKTARTSASRAGGISISMRSWLSESINS